MLLVLWFVGLVASACTYNFNQNQCSCDILQYQRVQSCGPRSGSHCDATSFSAYNSTTTQVITITGVAPTYYNATVVVNSQVYLVVLYIGNTVGYITLPTVAPYGSCDTCQNLYCQCRPSRVLDTTYYYDRTQLFLDVTNGCSQALVPAPEPQPPPPPVAAPVQTPGTCTGPGRTCSGSPPSCAPGCGTQVSGGYTYCAGTVRCASLTSQAVCQSYSSICSWSTGATCFHETTVISYAGKNFTLPKFLEEEKKTGVKPVCVVPHIVNSDGVKITTNCENIKPLRLTSDHLVFTQDGLKSADALKVGDFLFQDLKETAPCEVSKIEFEQGETYFGLNCEESVVLANGIKASTFGTLHSIPATWMKYVSKIVGLQRASALGDVIASVVSYFGLI